MSYGGQFKLTNKEIYVLQNRIFKTLKQISKELNLGYVRIMQIESKACRKLQHWFIVITQNHPNIYELMKAEFNFFNYLIENEIIDWYDIDNDRFHKGGKEVKDKRKLK